jgi:hypothetical protein
MRSVGGSRFQRGYAALRRCEAIASGPYFGEPVWLLEPVVSSLSGLARWMGRSAWLVLISHVSGLTRIASLGPFVCFTLHLLVGLVASLERFVWFTVRLAARLLARCGWLRSRLLLSHCREGNRASGNDNHREN